ncbi:MAG: substrate-binding domain-containing protein [Phycisphaeraceae bacterium]
MTTLCEQAKTKVLDLISRGEFPVGEFLPRVDELAPRLQHTEATMRKALVELAEEHVVRRIRHKGTQVVRLPRQGRVALLLGHDPHLNSLVAEPIYTALYAAGYDIEMVPYTSQPAALAEHCARLRAGSNKADYLVALESPLQGDSTNTRYWEALEQFPHRVYFAMSTRPLDAGAHWISPDHTHAARQVVDHLLSLGHRRIAAPIPGRGKWEDELGRTIQHLVEVAGGTFVPTPFLGLHVDQIEPLLIEQGVTAYWAILDHNAMIVMNQLLRHGVRVPEDFSVVGRNDTPWSAQCAAPLTTVSLNPPAIARAVTEAVQSLTANGKTTRGDTTLVKPELIVRQSTGPAPVPAATR